MSTTIHNITAPSLDNPNYASDLSSVFNKIDSNFEILSNHDFIQGKKGTSVFVEGIRLSENADFKDKIKTAIRGQYKDNELSSISIGTDTKNWDDNLDNSTIYMIKDESINDSINDPYIGSLYYVFLDARFADSKLSSKVDTDGTNLFLGKTDTSCVLVYQKNNDGDGEFVALRDAFPKLYYDISKGFCWNINGQESGIPVQGLPGKEGKSSSINIVICNDLNPSSPQIPTTPANENGRSQTTPATLTGTVNYIFVDGSWHNPTQTLNNRLGEFDNQTALIISPNPTSTSENEINFYFGTIHAESYLTVTTAYSGDWTGLVEDSAVINLFRNACIDGYNFDASGNGPDVKLPGLFLPINPPTSANSQSNPLSAHLIAAVKNTGDATIYNDLIITPVENIDNIDIDDINSLQNIESNLKINYNTTINGSTKINKLSINELSGIDDGVITINSPINIIDDENSNKILTIDNDGLNIFEPTNVDHEITLNLSRNGNINCKELTVDKATIKGDTNITGVLKVLASSDVSKIFEVNNGNVYANAFYQKSDNRLKNFGEAIPVDLDKLKTLKKNYFTWKDGNKDTQIGVSAQEIQEIYPELVSTDENGMLSVAYDKLSVVALAAVDKLHDENKALEKRIKDLEDKFEALLSRINY